MPSVSQNIIDDATDLILNYIRQTSKHVDGAQRPALHSGNSSNTHQGIDEEIYAIEEMLTSLNTRMIQRKKERNRLISFNQLPLEIAINILWLSVVDPWKRKISFSYLQRLQAILSVCSSWQTLVEGSSQFWSIIEFSSPQAAISHLLQKSKSSPLEIKCFSHGNYNCAPGPRLGRVTSIITIAYLDLIAPHWHRVRSLILSTPATYGVLELFEKPAPLLEELKLSLGHCTFAEPLDLFCGQAGRLKDVALENIPVRWDSGVFVGLRSLKIKGRLEYSPIVTMEQVRRLMEANPELEKMEIEDVAVSEDFSHEMAEFTRRGKWNPVIMSKIQELKLFSLPFDLIEAILGNIEVPFIKHLDLKCLFRGPPDWRLWSRNLQHLTPPILRRSTGTEFVEIKLGEGSVGLAIYLPRQENPTIQIQLHNTGRPGGGIEWLAEKLLREDGLPAVAAPEIFQVSLTFGDKFDMGGRAFVHFLDQLRAVKVKNLTIEGGCRHAEELIKYLGEVQEDSRWPLLHLMSLTIAGPAEIATYLSIALQRRNNDTPTEDTVTEPRPVLLEVLNIEGLGGVERKVEKALAKCISSSATFIHASRRSLMYRSGYGDDWEEVDDDDENGDMYDYYSPPTAISPVEWEGEVWYD